MKKTMFGVLICFILFFGSLTNTSAAEKDGIDWSGKVIETLVINEYLSVEKLNDGRVKPIDQKLVNNISEKEIDRILIFMGYNPFELIYDVKVDIIKTGGKAPESTSYTLKIKDFDENNNLISEEEIDLNKSNSFSLLSSQINECRVLTGCFKGNLAISYVGKSGSNHQYRFYYNFDFPSGSNGYDDYVGLSWRSTGTKKAGSDVAVQYTYNSLNNTWYSANLSLRTHNIYGSVYRVPSSTSKYYGYYRTDVYYSDRLTGDIEILAGNYAANWQSILNTINIGPASISISNTDKQYILEKNFTVGR